MDVAGNGSVFLRDDRFVGTGVNLNGLVVHPDGYLLVIKKSDGALFKVPLANPSLVARVDVPAALIGGDGVTLLGRKNLVVIANQVPGTVSNAAFSLSSQDDWRTAQVRAVQQLEDAYPTTSVVRHGELHVLFSKLNELIQAPAALKAGLRTQATIQRIGSVAL